MSYFTCASGLLPSRRSIRVPLFRPRGELIRGRRGFPQEWGELTQGSPIRLVARSHGPADLRGWDRPLLGKQLTGRGHRCSPEPPLRPTGLEQKRKLLLPCFTIFSRQKFSRQKFPRPLFSRQKFSRYIIFPVHYFPYRSFPGR